MSTEVTPPSTGLTDATTPLIKREDAYQRFSPQRKRAIIALISLYDLIPLFVNGTFTPSIAQIAIDLNTTGSVVNYAISVSRIATSLGGLIGGSYSTFYGRKAIYDYSLPLAAVGSIGVAMSQSIPALLCFRFIQSLGVSTGQVQGAGVIGDIYKLEEWGRAMGVFFAIIPIGLILAPTIGGWVTYYYSWRFMQASLGVAAAVSFVIMFIFFPETIQPGTRGIDKAQAQSEKKIGIVFINPLRLLLLLRSPVLFSISMILSVSLISSSVMLVPLAYTIGKRHNIPNEALLGLCFLPTGLGNMAGAIVVGRMADQTVIKWRKKRGGIWYPEDRLRAAIFPIATLVPVSLVVFGITGQTVDGPLGLTICLLCLFMNGLGAEMALGPCIAYLVDIMHIRGPEALAAVGGLRSIMIAASIAIILPIIDSLGLAAANTISAMATWFTLILLFCVIRYGDEMRAWVDVGFAPNA